MALFSLSLGVFWGTFRSKGLGQSSLLCSAWLRPWCPFFSGQSGTLKTALLDYIKRCRPGDSEKHNMIALCFSMCREIGENHEAAACIQLKLIESQPWGKQRSQQHPQGSAAGQGRVSGLRTPRNQQTNTHLSLLTFIQWVPAGQKGGGRRVGRHLPLL